MSDLFIAAKRVEHDGSRQVVAAGRMERAVSETPAETIRRAAALMRTRAQAATQGPWEHPLPGEVTYGYHHDGSRHVATWIANTDAGDEDADEDSNAEHIASWHPGVALAVAEWLERTAADVSGAPVNDDGSPVWGYCDEPGAAQSALRVARTYLGETADA